MVIQYIVFQFGSFKFFLIVHAILVYLFSLSGLDVKAFKKLKGSQSFELILERSGDDPCDRVFVVGDRVIISTEKNTRPVRQHRLEDIEDYAVDQRFSTLSLLLPIIDVASCSGSITKVAPNVVHIELAQKPRRLIEYVKLKSEKRINSEWALRLDRDESFSTMNTLRYVSLLRIFMSFLILLGFLSDH